MTTPSWSHFPLTMAMMTSLPSHRRLAAPLPSVTSKVQNHPRQLAQPASLLYAPKSLPRQKLPNQQRQNQPLFRSGRVHQASEDRRARRVDPFRARTHLLLSLPRKGRGHLLQRGHLRWDPAQAKLVRLSVEQSQSWPQSRPNRR